MINLHIVAIIPTIVFDRAAKRSRRSAAAVDTASDSDDGGSGEAAVEDKISPGSASRKINAKGLEILSNGVVSMRSLDLKCTGAH